jgi:hypothetical protein
MRLELPGFSASHDLLDPSSALPRSAMSTS